MKVLSKEMVQVSINEMIEIVKEIENSVPVPFINIKMRTPFDTLKKSKIDGEENPYYKGIFKITNRNFRLVTDYETRVKNNLIKEHKNPNTFCVEPPKGKEHISKSILIDTATRTKYYLMVEMFNEIQSIATEYEFQGDPIGKELFQKYISDAASNSNEKQGLNKEIKPITPNFANILQISINNKIYVIKH